MFRCSEEKHNTTRENTLSMHMRVPWAHNFILLSTLLLAQVLVACSLYTIRPMQAASNSQSNQFDRQFNPSAYVNALWNSKVVPTILNKSTDLHTVLAALKANTAAAEKQYATLSSDGFYNFMVKGQGQVMTINTDSRNGTLRIQLPAFQGQPAIIIQIGPVILSTAIRDSVGFINFNQFTNQVQYAQVSDELNVHAVRDLQGINFTALKGKMITFYGAFTFISVQQINIVPVKIIPEGAVA